MIVSGSWKGVDGKYDPVADFVTGDSGAHRQSNCCRHRHFFLCGQRKREKREQKGQANFREREASVGMMFISVESGAGGLHRGSDLRMYREVKRGLSGRKSGFNPANRNSDDPEILLPLCNCFVFTALVKSINIKSQDHAHGGFRLLTPPTER